ncbi:MAG: hypothetical protein JST75_10030 [Bacteroidetes bacterium]|nr:hypothetical protein [Bacteroidota bacterium]
MCIFNDYIRQQEELKAMQKDIIIVSKNYNNELKLFQKGNIIDSYNAEKVKQKYDELQEANKKISEKQTELDDIENKIQDYLNAMNGMAIRYAHNNQGINQQIIFESEINSYGEPKIKTTIAD